MLFILMMISIPAFAINVEQYNNTAGSVTNWKAEAIKHLQINEQALFQHKFKRCIKLNNYWCLKDVGWNGGIGKDADNHTAFKNGYYAARAAVRNFRTAYIKHGRKSALSIMLAYAPTSDCIGSNAARSADGTCIHGSNDSKQYAKAASKGITDDIHADLMLFDGNGKATKSLVLFLKNMSSFEIGGLRVSTETIERGICMENATCESP